MNEELIRRLRDAQGGMHKCTVDEADKYRCDRGTCACYDRHVELLEESIAALEAASLNERRLSDFLHDRRIHPDYEYRTTTGQRKCWDGDPDLTKEGWELNKTASNQDAFERFEYHEEMHWRRALSGEGVGG